MRIIYELDHLLSPRRPILATFVALILWQVYWAGWAQGCPARTSRSYAARSSSASYGKRASCQPARSDSKGAPGKTMPQAEPSNATGSAQGPADGQSAQPKPAQPQPEPAGSPASPSPGKPAAAADPTQPTQPDPAAAGQAEDLPPPLPDELLRPRGPVEI